LSHLVQVTPGQFEPTATVVDCGAIRLRRFVYNLGVCETLNAQNGVVLAYLQRQCGLARLAGETWFNHRLAMILGRAEFNTNEACVLTLLEVDSKRVPILGELLARHPRNAERFAIVPADTRLQARVDAMLSAGECSEIVDQRKLLASIIRVVESALRLQSSSRLYEQRQAIAGAAEAYMWAHIDDEFTLDSICRGIGCGPRTLIGYFHQLYGMGPIRYLKILRLNRVRQALRAGDSERATVFDLAADQGFWHMGHFSSSYRLLFGETPFETLRAPRRERL
jgi:AraC family ethanolamine operon transcriptional activator